MGCCKKSQQLLPHNDFKSYLGFLVSVQLQNVNASDTHHYDLIHEIVNHLSSESVSIAGALYTLTMPAPGDIRTDIKNIAGPRIGIVYTCTV